MEPKPADLTGGIPWSRSWPSAQAQLNTFAQAALLFSATHEDPGCITEFWARVVL